MRRSVAVLAIGTIAACSSLPDGGGGAVALEVLTPASTSLGVGTSLTLHARALNLQGDSIDAPIFWHTPDTAFATLDTVLGIVTARAASGVVRVQAKTGTLLSNVISLTLRDTTTASTLHGPR